MLHYGPLLTEPAQTTDNKILRYYQMTQIFLFERLQRIDMKIKILAYLLRGPSLIALSIFERATAFQAAD